MAEGDNQPPQQLVEEEEEDILLSGKPVIWSGSLELAYRQLPITLYLIGGNSSLPQTCIPYSCKVLRMNRTIPLLKKKEAIQLKTSQYFEHSVLIGLPESKEDDSSYKKLVSAQKLQNLFVEFLYGKQRVGCSTLRHISFQWEKYTLYVFPHCRFSEMYLLKHVANECTRLTHSAYLLFILTKESTPSPYSPISILPQSPPCLSNEEAEAPDSEQGPSGEQERLERERREQEQQEQEEMH